MYYGWGHTMGWGFGLFGLVWGVLFWVLIAYLIFSLFRHSGRNDGWKDRKEDKTPMDILKERYAKGEINKKEYEEMKKDLSKD